MTESSTDTVQELEATRERLHSCLASEKSLRIQNDYLRAELIDARAELERYAGSNPIEVAV